MNPPLTPDPSPLERAIVQTLLYFDLFDHPLSVEEIARFCPLPGVTPASVREACGGGALRSLLREESSYFSLGDSSRATPARRRAKEAAAARLWPAARAMSRLISHFPFVRGVFISGELAKNVAGEASDIDYVVIAAERRLWICRTLLILFKKTVLLNRRRYFCINHVQTVDHLDPGVRSYYAAVEVATLTSVCHPGMLSMYVRANRWISDYLPNDVIPDGGAGPASVPGSIQRILEALLPSLFADRLDRWLQRQWQRIWQRRYAHLSSEARGTRFVCTPYLSTAYGTDIANEIQVAWSRRMRELGLTPLAEEAA